MNSHKSPECGRDSSDFYIIDMVKLWGKNTNFHKQDIHKTSGTNTHK